jgi:hypothetical protein
MMEKMPTDEWAEKFSAFVKKAITKVDEETEYTAEEKEGKWVKPLKEKENV